VTVKITGIRPQGARAAKILAVAGAALLVASCASDGGMKGTAFAQEQWSSIGAKAIRPGVEIGLLYYDFENTSHSTVVVESVGITGPGIGTVVRPVQIRMAPLRYGWHRYERNSTALALYTTDPPVMFEGTHCRLQALVPVRGFRMTLGSEARVWACPASTPWGPARGA
jgi:hypothetical protein